MSPGWMCVKGQPRRHLRSGMGGGAIWTCESHIEPPPFPRDREVLLAYIAHAAFLVDTPATVLQVRRSQT